MKKDSTFAQKAAEWHEREAHDSVMKKLDEIKIEEEVIECDDSMGSEYSGMTIRVNHARPLPVEFLKTLVERGNHDEIMKMISKYNHFFVFPEIASYGYLPATVQVALVKRHDADEIRAITERYGFCAKAQEAMFETWSHEDLVAYAKKHGFCEKCQKIIFKSWSHEELVAYTQKHNFVPRIEETIVKTWPFDEIRTYFMRHGLSSNGQITLLSRGSHEEILEFLSSQTLDECFDLYIAIRGYHDEIMALLEHSKHKGRCTADVFDVIVAHQNSDEICSVIPLLPAQSFNAKRQREILARNNDKEIITMLKSIPLCPAETEKMLSEVKEPVVTKLFAFFTQYARYGLENSSQETFIKTSSKEAFRYYAKYHAFNKEVDFLLLEQRSDDDILCYVNCGHILSNKAESLLAESSCYKAKLNYALTHKSKSFIFKLLQQPELDYKLLSEIFVYMDPGRDNNEAERTLMREGSKKEVEEYFKDKVLTLRSLITLFFRADIEVFETYIRTHKNYYK